MELNGESAKIAKTRVAELMQELGLEDACKLPDRLSGNTRVAIARALIHDPNLVLADEPTGNLDRQTGEQALRLFRELIRKAGKTMIVATHSSDVLGIADRVISLEEGKLIENEAFNCWGVYCLWFREADCNLVLFLKIIQFSNVLNKQLKQIPQDSEVYSSYCLKFMDTVSDQLPYRNHKNRLCRLVLYFSGVSLCRS